MTDDEFKEIHERIVQNIKETRRIVERGNTEAKFYLDRVDMLTHYSMLICSQLEK